MNAASTVTVLIPARNEEADIERCLRAVLAQDHLHDRMEVVLVDGGSTDATPEVARRVLSDSDVSWKIVENPTGTTPSNLNVGLTVASGEILCRVDARSLVPPDYVRCCAEILNSRPDVAVTGGAQVALARDDSARAVGIARALNNRFAMGGARYRSGAGSGPSDTVYLGAFRTEELREAGGWDEYFVTNQDYELNRRMGRAGLVWFDSRLRVGYVPRRTLGALWTQYHRFGRWKVRYWRHTSDRPQRRQLVLLAGTPLSAAASLAASRWATAWRRLGAVVGLGGVLVAIEDRGCVGPQGGLISRGVATVSMVTVGVAWASGAWRELLAGKR